MHADTEVLVIGAGPAGAAAAAELAGAGVDVILADRHTFPRDKICGDALIPDSAQALTELGLSARIAALAAPAEGLELHAPAGDGVYLPVPVACLPRRRLDAELVAQACERGARLRVPWQFTRLLHERGEICGAEFRPGAGTAAASGDAELQIRARWLLLATGANAAALSAAGTCTRKQPSAIAARAYFRLAPGRRCERLYMLMEPKLQPGYGWIFPCPGGIVNVGWIYFYDNPRLPAEQNLRRLFEQFCRTSAIARRMLDGAAMLDDVQGAPLRCGLAGATLGSGRLLVLGEAAGTTYSFSGEGIGKALESGCLAARSVLAARRTGRPASAASNYAQQMEARYRARYLAYKRAQAWLARAPVANLIARRARPGGYIAHTLQAVLQERANPDALFSLRGMLQALMKH